MVSVAGLFLVAALVLFPSLPLLHSSAKPIARKEDIPYIKCQVCEKIARQLHNEVDFKQSQIAPKKMSEFQIIEITENLCDMKKAEGGWIPHIDIVEKGDSLELLEQDTEGQCHTECKTIEKACQEVVADYDTELAEYIFKNKLQIESLTKILCHDLSSACSGSPPPVPKDRIPGEPFLPLSEQDARRSRIRRTMKVAPGMKIMSKEDFRHMPFYRDEDDEDDDDDNDPVHSSLGKSSSKNLRFKAEGSTKAWKAEL